jgi:hypothetical protein
MLDCGPKGAFRRGFYLNDVHEVTSFFGSSYNGTDCRIRSYLHAWRSVLSDGLLNIFDGDVLAKKQQIPLPLDFMLYLPF